MPHQFVKLVNKKALLLIVLLAIITRFVGIDWALPYHPHPDEWNMANAITRIDPKDRLNPHFFAYGQFPLYLSYFSASTFNRIPWVDKTNIDLTEAILFLRLYSGIASVLTVAVVYLITRRLLGGPLAVVAALLTTFSPGMVQNAHFGTTEALLTLFFSLLVYLSLKLVDNFNVKKIALAGIVLGMAAGTKLSGIAFGLPIFVAFLLATIKSVRDKNSRNLLHILVCGIFFLLIMATSTIIFSPHLLISYNDSWSTLRYETSVATGNSSVFYTRQYLKTIPIVFQLTKIFPYTVGLPVLIFSLIGLTLSIVAIFYSDRLKKKRAYWFIVVVSFLGYFFSQAFLFAKWTRFVAPIFPLFSIFALFVWDLIRKEVKNRRAYCLLLVVFCFLNIIQGLYFFTIYTKPDIRFSASEWIYENIPSGSALLYDTGNVVDIPVLPPTTNKPLPTANYRTTSFDFYGLDENKELFPKLLDSLVEADYIFIPSRRIFTNHMRFPDKFPLVNRYYELLFSGELGFIHTKTFLPLPQLTTNNKQLTNISDEQAEETWSVFDHPVIRIYQKTVRLTKEDYIRLFEVGSKR